MTVPQDFWGWFAGIVASICSYIAGHIRGKSRD